MTLSDPSKLSSAIPDVLGVVLAGGQSSRMNVDKATLSINGVSNLDRAVTTLNKSHVNNVVISGNNSDKHIPDRYPNGGPLCGIFSVLLNAKALNKSVSALLVIPVDMPLLTPKLINTLIEQGVKNKSACCYQSYNLPIFIPVTNKLLDFLTIEFLSERFTKDNKGPSFNHLLKHIGCQYIETPDNNLLVNANTPEQWSDIRFLI